MFGVAHFNTFDNKTYTFNGKCNYVLVKLASEPDKLKVVVNNDANCNPLGPCQKTVTIFVYGVQVDLGKRDSNGHFMVKVNNEEIDKFPYMQQPERAVYIKVMVCIYPVNAYTLASHQCGPGSIPARHHMWVEFVVGSRPCSNGFSPGCPGSHSL